jgi:ferredoxin-NADP reductase/DMSO/TMAO reductase YedYZ heme-binding membrane subunit
LQIADCRLKNLQSAICNLQLSEDTGMKVSRFARSIVWLNCAVPLILLAWDAVAGRLGANPVNFAIRTTGILSLIFIILTLAITPVSRMMGWGWMGQFRRVLGLYAFFHAGLHFLIFFWFDRAASVLGTLSEIAMRTYLMVGIVGLVLMAPLAITSTNGMIKRLGPKRWKLLHRLVYVVAIAGALHFAMLVKADLTRPIAFAIPIALLFAWRLGAHYFRLRRESYLFRNPVGMGAMLSRQDLAGPSPPNSGRESMPPLAPGAKPKHWSGQLRVVKVFQETPDVRTFRLVSTAGPHLPFDFLPGQFLNVSLMIAGKKVNRSYTIASSPTRIGSCELTVKREAMGTASRHLHDSVDAGTLINVYAPAGRFTFTGAESDSLVMIAGGVGITPLMAKIRYLTDIGWTGDIYLVFSVKTERDIIFRDELDYLQLRFPNLHVTVTLTRAEGSSGGWERGRITPGLLNRVVPQISTRRVHICGPTEMTELTRQMLLDLGVPAESIKSESFTSPARASAQAAAAAGTNGTLAAAAQTSMPAREAVNGARTPHPSPLGRGAGGEGAATLTFARSGKSLPMSAQKTVLEAAEDLGVSINYDCRSGICGQCKTKLLAGHVTMDTEDALTPVDRANNLILSCQARCIDQVAVEA